MVKVISGILAVCIIIMAFVAVSIASQDREPSIYPAWLWPVVGLIVVLTIGGALAWKKIQEHHERE